MRGLGVLNRRQNTTLALVPASAFVIAASPAAADDALITGFPPVGFSDGDTTPCSSDYVAGLRIEIAPPWGGA